MSLLGNLMVARKRPLLHLVVCGGSALIALNLVVRTTRDVDVLATLTDGQLHCARPLPDWLDDDANAVRSNWAEHLSGRRNLVHQLWSVLMFLSWKRKWIDRR